MQLEHVKTGIVAYGFEPMPSHGRAVWAQQSRTRFLRTAQPSARNYVSAYTVEFSPGASAAAVLVCGFCPTAVAVQAAGTPFVHSYSFDVHMVEHAPSRPEAFRAGDEQIRNAILEMRPAPGSLQDKVQEEMSEFEREYPW